MKTIEAQKAELMRQMEKAEKERKWVYLAVLARQGQELDDGWFPAATFLQAATIERLEEIFPRNPFVREAIEANRRVRELADGLEAAQKQ